jgi:hypothetical protein
VEVLKTLATQRAGMFPVKGEQDAGQGRNQQSENQNADEAHQAHISPSSYDEQLENEKKQQQKVIYRKYL